MVISGGICFPNPFIINSWKFPKLPVCFHETTWNWMKLHVIIEHFNYTCNNCVSTDRRSNTDGMMRCKYWLGIWEFIYRLELEIRSLGWNLKKFWNLWNLASCFVENNRQVYLEVQGWFFSSYIFFYIKALFTSGNVSNSQRKNKIVWGQRRRDRKLGKGNGGEIVNRNVKKKTPQFCVLYKLLCITV